MFLRARLILPAALALLAVATQTAADSPKLEWRDWNATLFDQAKSENRFVILDLEAVWCHWCHVMEETTYADPRVIDLLARKYIPVRVDQDANPDLSNRYGDWGWPATIVFAPDGTEIVKLRGYIPPERMTALLAEIIEDPSPGPSAIRAAEIEPADEAFLTTEQRKSLDAAFAAFFDAKNGGWGSLHKYIDTDSMDLVMLRAEAGDVEAARRARITLDAALSLIDREWGGVYQYSDADDWKSPHYEKIMWFQAQYLRHYSQAYALWKEPRYHVAAKDIYRYLTTRLTGPEGGFYVSQDADVDGDMPGKTFYALSGTERDKVRREPRIDKSLYARENGWAVGGLAAYYNATGEREALDRAVRAARWVMAHRMLPGGGYAHGANDRGGPFLGDTLAMAQASLDLYAATGDRAWLAEAASAGGFIAAAFGDASGGYKTSAKSEAAVGVLAEPVRQRDEQIMTARIFNRLHRYLGDAAYRGHAEHAMRYLVGAAAELDRAMPGVLLADYELGREPTHITIVARKGDPDAEALHAAGRAFPAVYKRLDWWDRREGPLPNPDVTYPEFEKAAAFACTNRICSLPVFEPAGLAATVSGMLKLDRTSKTE